MTERHRHASHRRAQSAAGSANASAKSLSEPQHEPGAAPTRLLALILLTVTLGAVWLWVSPTAKGWRLAQTTTDTLRLRAAARPDDMTLQLALGRRLVSEGKGAEALPALQQVMEKSAGDPAAIAAYGAALAQAGRDEEAFQHLRFALSRGPRGDAHRALGALYLKHDRPDKAIPELEQAVRLEPESWEGWHLLALARQREGTWTEAEKALRRAVERRRNDSVLRLAFAEALIETGQLDEAELELKRLIPYMSGGPEATAENRARHRILQGRLYLEREVSPENLQKAETALRDAITADPTMAAPRHALAELLLRTDRAAEAEAEARAALDRDPSLLAARHLRARALVRLGRAAEAARERARCHRESELSHQEMQLRGRLTLRPEDPSLHERLARVLEKRGAHDEASACRETARKLRGARGGEGDGGERGSATGPSDRAHGRQGDETGERR
jgi:predicted Zn-dependent protease